VSASGAGIALFVEFPRVHFDDKEQAERAKGPHVRVVEKREKTAKGPFHCAFLTICHAWSAKYAESRKMY